MKTIEQQVDHIQDKYESRFKKDFYMWSEVGFWLDQMTQALKEREQIAKEEERQRIRNHIVYQSSEVVANEYAYAISPKSLEEVLTPDTSNDDL